MALAGAAAVNMWAAGRAERNNPPKGRFVTVHGVRLHYLDEGQGEPLVLLHGNGSSTDELLASGLVREAARKFRVLAFDRPGFGHTERPSGSTWSAERQADLIAAAMERLGAPSALVYAHSWGVLVALNLALKHPGRVRALTLEGGYYFPTVRADALLAAPSALPVLGDILANTVSPLVARASWDRAVRKAFAPSRVPGKFRTYDREMA
ncbi:MAG: alpha/beta hydrolase, partial [Beijerinckiaceae bacterium]|nr:alpha/beta hydrolase [Beijerinckiaceae bacterium]